VELWHLLWRLTSPQNQMMEWI